MFVWVSLMHSQTVSGTFTSHLLGHEGQDAKLQHRFDAAHQAVGRDPPTVTLTATRNWCSFWQFRLERNMLGLARRLGGFAVCWCSDSDFACLCLRVWWLSWWCCSFRFLQLFVCMVLSLAVFQGTHFHLAELPTGLKTITLLSFQLCPTFLLIFSLLFWCPIWFLAHQPSVTTFNVALREFYTSWQLKPATQVWDERKWSGCKVGGPKHLGVGAIFSSFQRRSPNLLGFPDLGFPLPDSVFFPFLGFDVFVVFFFLWSNSLDNLKGFPLVAKRFTSHLLIC